ncbi:MAG: T9SS type A sorting domain-containing protein [Bacteroidales bacterium]|nr:T9SS type A sorting domain-containing protein [Bacteroidales bacterium]
MRRCFLYLVALLLSASLQSQSSLRCEYWFDRNHSQRQSVDFTGDVLQAEFETAALREGLHTLNLHVQDSGEWSSAVSYSFLKLSSAFDNGQWTDISYKYWLDRDYSSVQSGNIGNGILLLDLAEVSEGLHSINVLIENNGAESYLNSFSFLKVSDTLSSSGAGLLTYKCWFDTDMDSIQSGSLNNGTVLLDTENLETGLHTVNVLIENDGVTTSIASYSFLKLDDAFSQDDVAFATYKCWFDNDIASAQSGSVGDGMILLETENLSAGLHTVNVTVDVVGTHAFVGSYSFLKLDEAFTEDALALATYKCWFDNDIASAQSGSVGDGMILLETDALRSGVHTVNVLVEVNGVQSNLSSYMFLKLDNVLSGGSSAEILSCSYWFDEDYVGKRTGTLSNGTLFFETDSLPAGIHYVNIQVNNSTPSALSRHIFFKEPLGGLGVCKYEYWLNDDFSSRTAVTVNPPSADYELVSLMPMDTVAFNPMSMYFDPNEGSPIVYAQNKIHFRFWNNLDFFSDTVKTYVDMMVSRNVLADTIERNTTEMIASPSGSNIHWFVLDAGIGDSLAFKADKGCALQLFAPSGEREMFSSGLTSIEWNTLTAKEAGFYHLAVSNASANNPNLNVSYFHLGKFDVVDYDVDRVGNGGYTNINYVGNGFDSLNTVMYINALNDTVTHVQIGHETNNHTSVLFNFSGADTGVYRAVFLFNDYVLTIDSALTIETARDIILTSNVSFPESYLRNSTVTYTLNITNTGNMTAYNIPFYAYIGSPNDSSISYIKFDGLDLPNIFESILDSIPENEREEWLRVGEEEIGDKHYFISNRGIDEETGDSVSVLSGYFLVTIAPYETKTLSLNITSNGIVDVWFTIPDTIAVQSTAPQMQYSDSVPTTMMASSVFNQYFCCWKDRIDCAFNIVGGFLNIAEALAVAGQIAGLSASTTVAGATAGLMLAGISVAAEILANLSSCIVSKIRDKVDDIAETNCMGEEFVTPYDNAFFKGFSTVQSVIGCLSGIGLWKVIIDVLGVTKVGKFIKALDYVLSGSSIFNNFTFEANAAFNECRVGFTQKKPNCPPKDPKGGKSNPVNSFDPNEIYGYIAESGSLAVGSEVEELFYTIQFENDTVFASSNASNVYLIDSLDSDLFDLSSFGARKVIIGSKEITLNGEKEFVRTMDMRPDINCLAQISLTFDSVNGVANWVFSTLDPISLEEINIPNRGFLPVNYYGEGIGEVMFTINRKNNLVDSTLIPNYATIIFDNNEGINTSIWQNVVDVTPPQSSVSNITITDTMALLTVQATDNISGVWKYDVFAQYGANAEWEKVGENIPIDSMILVRVYDGMNTGFVSIAIDSAGNVENKPLLRDNDIFALHVFSETNEMQGYVNGLGSYDSLSVVELTAVANVCYQFVSWNDGNTDNPRSFTLTKDTTFTALFEEIEFNTPISATICQGSVYNENGFNVSEAGIYTQNLTSVNGCDSIVTLTVSVNPVFDTTINATINSGETYAEFGFNESESGTYVQNLQTVNGCDSTITLNLTVNSSLYDVAELTEITFYPNPTSGKVTFSKEIEKIEVIDNIGKIVMRFFETEQIDIETLPSGAYYLRLTIEDKTTTRKVIKE